MSNKTTNNEPKITRYESGAIRDTSDNKEDYIETISFLALRKYAKYMTSKQSTYGAGNWRKGIPIESYEKSLFRHIQKYLANKYDNANLEPEEDHLCAMVFNIFGILHEQEKAIKPATTDKEITTPYVKPSKDPSVRVITTKKDSLQRHLDDIKYLKDTYPDITNEEIAEKLGVSARTIYRRVKQL